MGCGHQSDVLLDLSQRTNAGTDAGYGPLAPEAADRLDAIRAELDGLVSKLRSFLGKGAGGDLQQRLQQLGKTGDEIRLLSEIERTITAHGLIEFRGTLSMLLDRMEAAAFEVGIFGRVSSVKSSLLNYILQTDVLPIDVTPVTAIRLASATGRLQKAELNLPKHNRRSSRYQSCPNLRLNRGNKKHVTRIFVKLPSDWLSEGVTFVDTGARLAGSCRRRGNHRVSAAVRPWDRADRCQCRAHTG